MTRSSHRLIAVAAVAFAICYAVVILSLIDTWMTNSLYSYGCAVPLIAAYVIWSRPAPANASQTPADYRLGLPLVLLGVVLLVIGQLGALIGVEQLSFIVALAGLALLLFGRDVVKHHWFALAYLLLMIPIWGRPIAALQDPSRLLSTKIAMAVLPLIGVPALQQDTNIILASHTIAVLRECSGVNQLVALIAMVLPASYLWLGTNTRRGILLVSAVAISYIGNGVRIAIVCWLAHKGFGDGLMTGNAHLLQGLAVSVFGYLAIGACFSLLASSKDGTTAGPVAEASTSVLRSLTVPRRQLWLDGAFVVLMLAAAAARVSAAPVDVRLGDDLRSLDDRFGNWMQEIGPGASTDRLPGIDDDLVYVGGYPSEDGERRFTEVDNDLLRAYRTPSGSRIQLYVGYYERQRLGKELGGAASDALAAAASEQILSTNAGDVRINEIVRRKEGSRPRGLLFWYDVNGRIVPDIRRAKLYTILDAITHRSSNGAIVMIAWDAAKSPDGEAERQQALSFARALVPALRRHLPS